jgi:hypothetical protein
MGMKSYLVNAFAKDAISQAVEKKFTEKLKEANITKLQVERQDRDWRPLSTTPIKDFNPIEQAKMFKIAYFLYDKNGIGHAYIEMLKDFVIGDGVTWSCEDKDVASIIEAHWESPINQWEYKQDQKAKEIGLYGEQYYPVFVNEANGEVNLGYTDPEMVEKIETDINNVEKKIKYILFDAFKDKVSKNEYTIINLDEDVNSPTYGYMKGEAFFFAINNVTNQPRGRSDLFATADAIDAYENFLFNRAERADLMNRIVYDLEMQGLNEDEIKTKLKGFNIPRSNEIYGHNEKSKLTIKSPELGSQDASSEARLLMNHFLAGLRVPPTWFAMGEGLTKGTAMVMDMPTKKMIRSRQKTFRWMMQTIFRFVIHQAIIAKKLNAEKKNTKVYLTFPRIDEKEIEVIASALVNITTALTVAEESGWITSEDAAKKFTWVVSRIGEEMKARDNEESVEEEGKEKLDDKLKTLYGNKPRADTGDSDEGDND